MQLTNPVRIESDEWNRTTIVVPLSPPSYDQTIDDLTEVGYDEATDTLTTNPPDDDAARAVHAKRVIEWFHQMPDPVASTGTIVRAMQRPDWDAPDANWVHAHGVIHDRTVFERLVSSLTSFAMVEHDGLRQHRQLVLLGRELFPSDKVEHPDWTDLTYIARRLAARGIDTRLRFISDRGVWIGCLDTGSWVSYTDTSIMTAFLIKWITEEVIKGIEVEIAGLPDSIQALGAQYARTMADATRARRNRDYKVAALLQSQAEIITQANPQVAEIVALHDEIAAYQSVASAARGIKLLDELKQLTSLWITGRDLDRHDYMLRTPGATIDLRTHTVLPITPEQLLTKRTRVNYNAKAPVPARWLQFMEEVFPDPEVRAYVRMALGYSITGSAAAKCLFVVMGPGDNGKSVLMAVMEELLGDYASTLAETVITSNKQGAGHPTDLTMLDGLRFGNVAEISNGMEINTGRLKQLSSGTDSIAARHMRQDFYTFVPKTKLWLTGNDMPHIRDQGAAMVGRIVPIPMNVVVTKKDAGLTRHLTEVEGPGILNWLINAAAEWYRNGANRAALGDESFAQAIAKQEMMEESDDFSEFHRSWIERSHEEIQSSELYRIFQLWCKLNGIRPPSHRWFALDLKRRGVTRINGQNARFYKLALLPAAKDALVLEDYQQVVK